MTSSADSNMQDTRVEDENILRMKLSEALSIYEVEALESELSTSSSTRIELDLSELTEIDGAGMQWLLYRRFSQKRFSQKNELQSFSWVSPSQCVLDLAELCGMSEYFQEQA